MKCLRLSLLLFLLFSLHLFALPRWVSEFGGVTPYDPETYVTGFGQSDELDQDFLEAAKLRAVDDLIRKVTVQVKSDLALSTSDAAGRSVSGIEMIINSVSALQLDGVEYLVERDNKVYYALAYIEKMNIAETYLQRAMEVVLDIETGIKLSDDAFDIGDTSAAFDQALRLLPLFDDLQQARGVYRVTAGRELPDTAFGSCIRTAENIAAVLATLQKRIMALSGSGAANTSDAVRRIVQMLKDQGLAASQLTVAPLLYKATDFSSQFGQYLSQRLYNELAARLPSSSTEVVVRGRYWILDDTVEISVSAQDVHGGRSLGSALANFPRTRIGGDLSLEPENYAEAVKDMLQLADGALIDGGIGLEAWTNRGRDADSLVFGAGEELELYLRVNQPAFLQLTYALASGEKVLLEERFYIGVDKVNRVVKYPYAFEVVPPYGVERLIISAFSKEPPRPNVVPRVIGGEAYEVFTSIADTVIATRGLKRKRTNDQSMNTAESIITLTTVPELKE
jgi:hypothetical protein